MAVTVYPGPALPVEQVSFDLVVPQDRNRMEGRATEGHLYGAPFWRAQYRLAYLDRRSFGQADAFVRRVTSRGGVFRAHDAFRPRPIAHDAYKPLSGTKAGGGAFDGTANLAAIVNGRSITINGLPAGFQLSEGDGVELRMSDLTVSLHSVEADAVSSAGGSVTVSVDPLVPEVITAGAVVNLEKPSCLMQIDLGSWAAAKSWGDRNPTFSAEEVFPREVQV